MQILNKAAISEFSKGHANARKPLKDWVSKVEAASWTNLVDVKSTFNSADLVEDYIVFNIGGNNFRMVALVTFKDGEVVIVKVMTHAEYDGWKP